MSLARRSFLAYKFHPEDGDVWASIRPSRYASSANNYRASVGTSPVET